MRTGSEGFMGVQYWVLVLYGMRAARFKNAETEQQVEHPWNRKIRASCNSTGGASEKNQGSDGEASGKNQMRLAVFVVTTP